MIEVTVRTKKWGNSVGVILPKKLGFRAEEEVKLHIESRRQPTRVKDIFGTLKTKRSTVRAMKQVDRDLHSEV